MSTSIPQQAIAPIIASTPSVVGYVPVDALAGHLIANDGHRVTITCCVVMSFADEDQAAGGVEELVGHLARISSQHPGDWIFVAVATEANRTRAIGVLDRAAKVAGSHGVPVDRRILTGPLDQDGYWIDIANLETGPVVPYQDHPATAARVAAGHNVAKNRDDILAEFAQGPAPQANVSTLPVISIDELHDAGAAHGDVTEDLALRAARFITASVDHRDIAAQSVLSGQDVGSYADFWIRVARQAPRAGRVQALTLAALAYHLASDTVRSRIAADLAITEAATTSEAGLAKLVLVAGTVGLDPAKVRAQLRQVQLRDIKPA